MPSVWVVGWMREIWRKFWFLIELLRGREQVQRPILWNLFRFWGRSGGAALEFIIPSLKNFTLPLFGHCMKIPLRFRSFRDVEFESATRPVSFGKAVWYRVRGRRKEAGNEGERAEDFYVVVVFTVSETAKFGRSASKVQREIETKMIGHLTQEFWSISLRINLCVPYVEKTLLNSLAWE